METRLATVISEASFNLEEKTKIEQPLTEIIGWADTTKGEIKKLKEATNRADAAEEEILLMKGKLRDEQNKFKDLEEEKISTEIFLKVI